MAEMGDVVPPDRPAHQKTMQQQERWLAIVRLDLKVWYRIAGRAVPGLEYGHAWGSGHKQF